MYIKNQLIQKKPLFLIVLLFFWLFINAVIADAAILGDTNGDQSVNIIDALLIAQYSVGMQPAGFIIANADVNCVNSIDIIDALLIAQYSVNLITNFPCQLITATPTATLVPTKSPIPTPINYTYQVATTIRLDSIGYLPDKKKGASISAYCSSFTVKRLSDNAVVYTGTISNQINGVYQADFSSLTTEGIYYLDVTSVGKSPLFEISKSVYNFPMYTCMKAFYLWRSGSSVSSTHYGVTFSHPAAHMNDGYLDYITGSHTIKDGKGGWYDAGDYGKYIVNAGVTMGLLFKAWEQYNNQLKNLVLNIPETGKGLPDYLAELKWEMDWVLKMQYPDGSGKVSHKLTSTGFPGFIMPQNDTSATYFVPWGSAATADFVAMCAMASRVYSSYDAAYAQTCLNAATKSYNFLASNLADHQADQSGFSTGGYETTDSDDRLWAAAEMWETTGTVKYLTDLESRLSGLKTPIIDTDFDWGNVKNLGIITYLLSNRTGKNTTLVNQLKSQLLTVANSIVTTTNSNAYRRSLGSSYYWGCNGGLARQSLLLMTANMLSANPDYVSTALDILHHIFGRNNYCRSYVTGVGYNPPLNPHDRRSGSDGITPPWPGYLVGGGHTETGWVDNQDNYETNEIAVNWNSALIYALAPFINY